MLKHQGAFVKKSRLVIQNRGSSFILMTQKYSNLRIDKHILSCMVDLPLHVVSNVLGISETFMKKHKSEILCLSKWPHLYYDECKFVQSQRLLLIDKLKLEASKTDQSYKIYDYQKPDYENMIEILEYLQYISTMYNLAGKMKTNPTFIQSDSIKTLFAVEFRTNRQSVYHSKQFLDSLENDKDIKEMDDFVQNFLWTSTNNEDPIIYED